MEQEADDGVVYRVQERVATITLNVPHRGNALSISVMRGICIALQEAQRDERVAVIVLSASGRHFCAGADLDWATAHAEGDEALWHEGNAALSVLLHALFAISKPVVARVHGTVIGGGVAMLCLCDDVVAVAEANWRLPELRLGIVPSAIVPALRQIVGAHVIRRVVYDDAPWNSADAHGFGIVSHLATPQTLDAQVQARVDAWLVLPASGVAATKQWMRELGADDFRRSLERGQAYAQVLFVNAEDENRHARRSSH